MKLKNIFLLTGFLLPITSYAQYAEDAFRFSNTEQGATARFRALGGAQTALGGDISSIASNPAGLGLFTKNELNFTSDFSNRTTGSQYIGTLTDYQADKLGINQLGGVFHIPALKPKGSDLTKGWLGLNFGLAYNKTNNFNTSVNYAGTNSKNSFADYVADLANINYLSNGNPEATGNSEALPEGTLERMGYRNFLINYNQAGYFPSTNVNDNALTRVSNAQQNTDFRSGSQSEFNIAVGSNYGNTLYLGASIAVANINYNSDREFAETGKIRTFTGQDPNFIGSSYALSYRSTQITTGTGVNAKLGLIYRASKDVRIGLNFITPTWYSIDDSFSETLDTRYTRANGTAIAPYTNNEQIYDSGYTLRTPFRATGGLAITFGGSGLISGDVEYIDYTSIHFSSNDRASTDNTNRTIRNNYKNAVNFKVGGEYKISNVMLRAGYTESGNPYQNQAYSSNVISGGLGYRKNNVYIDLTYAATEVNYTTAPYKISGAYPDFNVTGSGQTAQIKDTRNNVYLTVGFRF